MHRNEFLGRTEYLRDLATVLCKSAGVGGFLVVGMIEDEGEVLLSRGWKINWGVVPPDSETPIVAYMKTMELFMAGEGVTPVLSKNEYTWVTGYMGGVRYIVLGVGDFIVAFSGLPQEHDRLLALLIHFAITNDVTLHHFGRRIDDKEAYEVAIEDLGRRGLQPIQADLRTIDGEIDHHRHYAPVYDGEFLNYMLEVQRFPGVLIVEGIEITHWDVAVNDPYALLAFLSVGMEEEPEIWGDEERPGPIGRVQAWSNKHLKWLAIMARYWTDGDWVPEGGPLVVPE